MKRLLLLAMASFARPVPTNRIRRTGLRRGRSPASSRGRPPLRIITWNVWFDHRRQKERLKLLLALLAKENADVHWSAGGHDGGSSEDTAARWCHGPYDISENDISGYGCLLLVRRELNPAFAELPLPTTIAGADRSSRRAELSRRTATRERAARVVGTVHLGRSIRNGRGRPSCGRSAPSRAWTCSAETLTSTRATWGEWRQPVAQAACVSAGEQRARAGAAGLRGRLGGRLPEQPRLHVRRRDESVGPRSTASGCARRVMVRREARAARRGGTRLERRPPGTAVRVGTACASTSGCSLRERRGCVGYRAREGGDFGVLILLCPRGTGGGEPCPGLGGPETPRVADSGRRRVRAAFS